MEVFEVRQGLLADDGWLGDGFAGILSRDIFLLVRDRRNYRDVVAWAKVGRWERIEKRRR